MQRGKRSRPENLTPSTIEENVLINERRLDNLKKKIVTEELIVKKFGAGSDISILSGIFTGTFSSTDYNTVAWTAGDLVLANGVTYSISAGNTGNIAARTYIYFDLNTPTIFTTSTTATIVISDGKTIIASAEPNDDITKKASYQLYIGSNSGRFFVDNSYLVAASVGVNELVNGAVTAVKTNLAGISATTGYIVVSDATAANIVTNGINGYASTLIGAGKILISGSTTLSYWSSGADATYIDGGKIYANTVTLTHLNFTPLVSSGASTAIVGTINASAEGIVISGARIELSGSTTITGSAFINGSILVNGTVSGAKVDSATAVTAGTGNDVAVLSGADATYRIWAGHATAASATFSVTKAGAIYAVSGNVGGFTLSASEGLYSGTGATRVQMKPGAGFWAGADAQASAPFRVSAAGALTATSGAVGGWTVGATTLTGTYVTLDSSSAYVLALRSGYTGAYIQAGITTGAPAKVACYVDGGDIYAYMGATYSDPVYYGSIYAKAAGAATARIAELLTSPYAGLQLTYGSGSCLLQMDTGFNITPSTGEVDFNACNIAVDSGKKVYLNGVGGNSYLYHDGTNVKLYVGGSLAATW